MEPQNRTARLAGLLYLVVVLTGFFSLAYVPAQLVVAGNIAATVQNIAASEMLFRLGIYAGVICYSTFVVLPLVLYKLLHGINREHAVAMVALALVSVPLSLMALTEKLAILSLLKEGSHALALNTEALHAQVAARLDQYNNIIRITTVFWGLWLFPFGYLVFRSGFLPRILGIFLMLGCLGYLVNFTGGFLFPAYKDLDIAGYVSIPSALGEIGTCLWLLTLGVKAFAGRRKGHKAA
jgi:hypothetical protein